MPKRKGYPEINELVVCTVNKITQFAAWCTLDEYNLNGIIHISEVAGKWVKDIKKHVKVGRKYVCKVMKIEPDKHLVTLSLRRVSRKEAKDKMNQFRKEERAEKLLELAAKEIGKTLDEAYEEVGFYLQEKFGDLYTAFESIAHGKLKSRIKIPEKWLKAIKRIAEKSIRQKVTEMKFDLEIMSYSPDGIEKIRNLIQEIEKKLKVRIKYISAPLYRLEIETTDPKSTEKKVLSVLESLKKSTDPIFNYRRIE